MSKGDKGLMDVDDGVVIIRGPQGKTQKRKTGTACVRVGGGRWAAHGNSVLSVQLSVNLKLFSR